MRSPSNTHSMPRTPMATIRCVHGPVPAAAALTLALLLAVLACFPALAQRTLHVPPAHEAFGHAATFRAHALYHGSLLRQLGLQEDPMALDATPGIVRSQLPDVDLSLPRYNTPYTVRRYRSVLHHTPLCMSLLRP
jgi:hypothetical protein